MQTRQQTAPHTLAEVRERQEKVQLVRLENEAARERAEASIREEKAAQLVPLAALPEEEVQALTSLDFTPTPPPAESGSMSFIEIGGTAFFVVVLIGMVVLAKRL